MDDSSNSNYAIAIIIILPSKRFEMCRQCCCVLLLSAYARRDCVRRFESRLTTYKMLALNSSRPTLFVADMVIPFGRYGLFVWPMWSWPIWFVADMVQTRLHAQLSSHKSRRCDAVELHHASHFWHPPFHTSPMAFSAVRH